MIEVTDVAKQYERQLLCDCSLSRSNASIQLMGQERQSQVLGEAGLGIGNRLEGHKKPYVQAGYDCSGTFHRIKDWNI